VTETSTVAGEGAFTAGADFQVHSIAPSGTAMFGPSLFYSADRANYYGLRTLLSLGSQGAYAAALVYRHQFSQAKTRIYLEPELAAYSTNQQFLTPALGAAIGLSHFFTPELLIGGSAGFEGYGAKDFITGAFRAGSVYISPKTSVQVSVVF
jgi:hypothetical protein